MSRLSFLPGPVRGALRRALLPSFMREQAWYRLLSRVQTPTRTDRARLWASAFADMTASAVAPGRAVSPRTLFGGRAMDRSSGAWFHFRAGTDDLYNTLPGGEQDVHEAI